MAALLTGLHITTNKAAPDGPHSRVPQQMLKQPTTTTSAIEAYLARCARNRLLIISIAVEEVRAGLPDCALSGDELAQLVALHAVAAGSTMISFDLKARRSIIALPVAWTIPGWGLARRSAPAGAALTSPPLPTDPAANNGRGDRWTNRSTSSASRREMTTDFCA